ncbi:diguanylate cyclase [Pseudothauera nasutitermitis]|uniref:diguanylate cyclase n=1 Tax=Pseudothauera nasutitermitis TaxID=2565930 RepID=A0A4S4ARH1_9RHOO|nr:diguanylate cyclase [Pseudothauera nasutitermitis]THF62298.1 diguanylate cyclase [Pseudothauera nasutitermitis]
MAFCTLPASAARAAGPGFIERWLETFSTTSLYLLCAAVIGLLVLAGSVWALLRANRRLLRLLAERRRDAAIMRSTMENMAEAVIMVDGKQRLASFNQRFAEITGFDQEFLLGQPPFADVLRLWAGENALSERVLERAMARARDGKAFRHTFVHHGRDYEGKHVPLPGGGFVRTISDVTEQHRAGEVLRNSEERLRRVLALAPTAIVVSDARDGQVLFVNPKAEEMAGVGAEQLLGGSSADFFLLDEDRVRVLQLLNQHGAVNDLEVCLLRASGEPLWALLSAMPGEFGGRPAVITAISDITARRRIEEELEQARQELEQANQQMRRANAELAQAASTDRLTGLANRRRLEEGAEAEMARARRHLDPLSVVLFDIDWFKMVNDRHGHEAGDAVLREVAQRLGARVRASDLLARWGGEEFLLLASATGLAEALVLAEKMRRLIEGEPFPGVGSLTASFGVAEFKPGENFSTLTARADRALYRAKEGGRNRVEWAAEDEIVGG